VELFHTSWASLESRGAGESEAGERSLRLLVHRLSRSQYGNDMGLSVALAACIVG